MENYELREYVKKFGDYPFLPMMASYDDDIFQGLLSMAILRDKPLTDEEISKYYDNKVDLIDDKGEDKMEEQKIRTMLKRYGAVDEEIENFMQDLANFKEEAQEDEDEEEFSPYSSDVTARLRETEEGKKILMNAPKMEREAFIKAVKDYLAK